MTSKQLDKEWDKFLDAAGNFGYDGISYNDRDMGIGSTLFKDDRFAPIIKFHIWPELKSGRTVLEEASVSIHVQDRNGNSTIDGPSCAIHSLKACPDFSEKFKAMYTYVFEKYSQYSRENRLDFAFNGYKEERKDWTEEKISERAEAENDNHDNAGHDNAEHEEDDYTRE